MSKTKCINRTHTLPTSWLSPLCLVAAVICAPAYAATMADDEKSASVPALTVPEKLVKPAPFEPTNPSEKTKTPKKSDKAKPEPIFATVNGKAIAVREFEGLYALTMQQRFYHGQVPEGQADVVRKEVTEDLVLRELMVQEAARRRIAPDPAKFERVLAQYDAQYSSSPGWPQEREAMLPDLKFQVDRHSTVEQLELAIRNVPQPTVAEVRAYYEKKPELFTQPESPHLSVILLKIDPSSSQDVWDKAREQAQGIYERIKAGGDFAKEASLHSGHISATNGGDMGFLHGGMLSEGLEEKLGKLKVGEMSEPIKLLEGISLYRVEDRIPAKLQEFSDVEERARDLLVRDRIIQARSNIVKRLRATAKVKLSARPASGNAGKLPKKK